MTKKNESLWKSFIANMNALCMQQLGGISLTVWNQEEIVQESLKKLIEKRRVLCNLDCAAQAGYIVVAIRNTSFSYLRKRNRERSKIISLETLNEEGMRHIILAEEEQLFYEEEIEKLKEGLKHLGPEDRALLEGKYLLKYGDKELARGFWLPAEQYQNEIDQS